MIYAATLSPCRTYRYSLERSWSDDNCAPCLFIGLNPSTADAELDDPTIRRCIRFARDWGHTGLLMGNLFALRSTDPRALVGHRDPVGPENDLAIASMAERSTRVVVAWGATDMGLHASRAWDVLQLIGLSRVVCLGRTKDGYPRHPLYVKASTRDEPYFKETP